MCYNKYMKIKEILKANGIKLSEFSDLLNVSRPTLNTYIKEYEELKEVSVQIYNKMFNELFKENSPEEFKKILKKWESILNGKEDLEKIYSSENLELMESIIKKMKLDLKLNDETNILYKFINSALYNYNYNLPLTAYINYNLYLNGLKNLEKIKSKEKKLISYLYPLMKKFTESELDFNEEGYIEFLNRVDEIKKERKKYIDKEIMSKLKEEIIKKVELGMNPKDIDIEGLLRNIK